MRIATRDAGLQHVTQSLGRRKEREWASRTVCEIDNGLGRIVFGSVSCGLDRRFRLDPRRVLEFVNHMAVARQGQTGVVTQLVGDINDTPALVQQQRGKAMSQVVGARVLQSRRRRRADKRASAP
jgi:hypothetical protein